MNRSKTVTVNTGSYFSENFQFVMGVITLFFLVITVANAPFLIPMNAVFLPIFTTKTLIEIDADSKTIRKYHSMFGESKGAKTTFSNINLILTKGKYSISMHHKSISSTIKKELYSGYVVVDKNEKVLVYRSDNRKEVLQKLRTISAISNTDIIDKTA